MVTTTIPGRHMFGAGSVPFAFESLKEAAAAALTGAISFQEFEQLDSQLAQPAKSRALLAPRIGRFAKPPRQRPPDRQRALERRRTLASTWALPPAMAAKLTVSEQAYCRLLADDYVSKGFSDASHAEMAARVGCCTETIQRSQRTLLALGWAAVERRPVEGKRNRTNLVRIIAPEWISWIRNGPGRSQRSKPPRPTPSLVSAPSRRGDAKKPAEQGGVLAEGQSPWEVERLTPSSSRKWKPPSSAFRATEVLCLET
jgi:hypothetical protein